MVHRGLIADKNRKLYRVGRQDVEWMVPLQRKENRITRVKSPKTSYENKFGDTGTVHTVPRVLCHSTTDKCRLVSPERRNLKQTPVFIGFGLPYLVQPVIYTTRCKLHQLTPQLSKEEKYNVNYRLTVVDFLLSVHLGDLLLQENRYLLYPDLFLVCDVHRGFLTSCFTLHRQGDWTKKVKSGRALEPGKKRRTKRRRRGRTRNLSSFLPRNRLQ